jgi:hypothetical protein
MALTRLLDPDTVLRGKLVEFVERGDFGLASGPRPDGSYEHVWYAELLAPEEVAFEAGVFLLTKGKAKALTDEVPPEVWNRLGTKVIPKLKSVLASPLALSLLSASMPTSSSVQRGAARSCTTWA